MTRNTRLDYETIQKRKKRREKFGGSEELRLRKLEDLRDRALKLIYAASQSNGPGVAKRELLDSLAGQSFYYGSNSTQLINSLVARGLVAEVRRNRAIYLIHRHVSPVVEQPGPPVVSTKFIDQDFIYPEHDTFFQEIKKSTN